jgi:molecular chaperone IbpA
MRTNMDFAPYRGSTVGFDRLFDLFESGFSNQVAETYPPFDLVQDGDDRYHITMVLAGFRPDEVEITAHQNVLIVSGRKQENEDSRYIHRGIAARDFERRFGLADYVKVRNAELKDGMLSIRRVHSWMRT